MAGRIYLVGAGPGDPGLLTIKGKQCLERADVVVYDYLANPRLLDHARPSCEKLLVGKHGGGASVPQSEINRLIVEKARQGNLVVRLKGGDPFIFGRGGEEAEAAVQAGIEFEVVPGVTSAVAVPAYAGIPLTHRDLASNVIFTTGYEYPNKPELAVHWDELARSGSTLVILMTQRQLRSNMAKLITSGLNPETGAAVVEWGTRAWQRTVSGRVADIADLADAAQIKPPSMAIVGDVVRLRERLSWIERKPLFGRRILITRPRHQSAELGDRLEEQGAEVVAFPTIEIAPPDTFAPVDAALAQPDQYDWIVFTSANGVQAFFDRLRHRRRDIREWHRARIAAIGPQTSRALQAFGLNVDLIPGEYRAEGVLEAFAGIDLTGKRFLLPRAAGAREVLPEQLTKLGAVVEEVVTYKSILPTNVAADVRELLRDGQVDLVTFTSSSTVNNFVALMGDSLGEIVQRIEVGCIGPITADTARRHGMKIVVEPSTYTVAAFAEAILDHYRRSVSSTSNASMN